MNMLTDPMHDVDFTWWDSLRYYYYFFEHAYADYAWVVRVSYFMTVFSVVSIAAMLIMLLVIWWKRRRGRRYQRRLAKHYAPPAKKVLQAPKKLTEKEYQQIIPQHHKGQHKRWQYKEQLHLLTIVYDEVRAQRHGEVELSTLYHNLHLLMRYHDRYIEDRLREGFQADRLYLMQMVQQFHLPVAESTLARLYDSKNDALRKVVRTYYMWASDEDPFRFMEEGDDYAHCQIDNLWIHRIFAMRHEAGKTMPSLMPYIKSARDEATRGLLICEVGWWSSDDEMAGLEAYFLDKSERCRAAAFATVGHRRFLPLEPRLMEAYAMQTEVLRRVILHALLAIGSGKAGEFFEAAVRDATSAATRRVALFCLWRYGPQTRATFARIREEAGPDKAYIFDYIAGLSAENIPTYMGMRLDAGGQHTQ